MKLTIRQWAIILKDMTSKRDQAWEKCEKLADCLDKLTKDKAQSYAIELTRDHYKEVRQEYINYKDIVQELEDQAF